jgi:hypothetical protein
MAALTATSQDIANAVFLRLQELGHVLSPSHQAAVLADIIATINTDAANVVADMAVDVVKFKPPPHNKF